MRRFFILCLLLLPCLAAQGRTYRVGDIPNVQLSDRTRYTSNPDGILSSAAVARIDSLCDALRRGAIAQVSVVAVDNIAGGDVFDFAIELFSKWGVGNAKNNNGLGILLVKDQREIRFVTGGGLEGVLPDAICKRIQIRYMLPAFREDDYSGGMVAGVEAVSQLLHGSELDLGETDEAENDDLLFIVLFITGIMGLMILISVLAYRRQMRCPRCGKVALRQQSSKIVANNVRFQEIEYTYVCNNCGYVHKRRVKRSRDNNIRGAGTIIGGLGGFGGGGGRSGGGGFGGGSFGGGGAGSRW